MQTNLLDKIKLLFRKDKELYLSLYDILGFYPHDIELYKQALLHKSVAHRNAKGKKINNERLEFLGDAMLDSIVGYIVFRHFPGKREGFLTNTRSKIVARETLGKLAEEMGLSSLILSSGRSGSHNSYMAGNAFEALVGAIYIDRGYKKCIEFVEKRILGRYINIDKVAYREVNFKSKLLEWSQKNKVSLEYRLEEQTKDQDQNPVFTYMVVLEGIDGCSAKGFSKKESQQKASELTLKKLKKQPQFIDRIFSAKTQRTRMEEEPVMNVPDPEADTDFINAPQDGEKPKEKAAEKVEKSEEFDLSDITHNTPEPTEEDIIAAALDAAYTADDAPQS